MMKYQKKTEGLNNEKDFSEYKLFIVLTGCILYNKERLQAIQFKNTYSKECEVLLLSIDDFFKGFDFVKNNKNFYIFLGVLLVRVNYIKSESVKIASFCLQLSSLIAL